MITQPNKSAMALLATCVLTLCTAASAYDAWPSDFQWISPQVLDTNTQEIKYSWRFNLSPSYPFETQYYTRLYLSRDESFSADDFLLFDNVAPHRVPARCTGFTATTTTKAAGRLFASLPRRGTYHVFLELRPGPSAPTDSDVSNNAAMAPGTVEVDPGDPPLGLRVAALLTAPHTGQSMVVAGYDDGAIDFCDWRGTVLASRDDLAEITALAVGTCGDSALPRLFVASTDSNGTLRVIDPTDIRREVASQSNLGTVTAIDVCNRGTGAVYIGTTSAGGTLRRLAGGTLADDVTRGGMGEISTIVQVRCVWGTLLAVGSSNLGGAVYFLDKDTLQNVAAPRQGLGLIQALASADVNADDEPELAIASGHNGGSVHIAPGPDFADDLAVQNQLGHILALDYGRLGVEGAAKSTGAFSVLIASEADGGSLRVLRGDLNAAVVTLEDQASRPDLGAVPYVDIDDFYKVGASLPGAIYANGSGPALHVLDESLQEPTAQRSPSAEDFETGDFSRFPWQHDGDAPWTITSDHKQSGTYSAQAGSIANNERTTLQVTVDCVAGDVTFYRKVSSEPACDVLKFYIDAAEQGRWSGDEDWAQVSFPVTAGTHTFRWTYSKDGSVSSAGDTAWIDDISYPVDSGAAL